MTYSNPWKKVQEQHKCNYKIQTIMQPTKQQRTPGLACPKCGHFIETSIAELISASYIECKHCRLRLEINKQESKKALEILTDVDKAQRKVQEASHFNR